MFQVDQNKSVGKKNDDMADKLEIFDQIIQEHAKKEKDPLDFQFDGAVTEGSILDLMGGVEQCKTLIDKFVERYQPENLKDHIPNIKSPAT